MNEIEKTVWKLCENEVEKEGCFLYLVEFVKEGKDRVLRLLIDSENGIDITQCENVSRAVSDILDEADPISESYMLEVSSPGLERKLCLPWHFEMYTGSKISVRLFSAEEGAKKHVGVLKKYDKENLVISVDDKDITLNNTNISAVNLYYEF